MTRIECDFCGSDLTSKEKMPSFRVSLSAERIPTTSGLTYAVLVTPPISETKTFCDLQCLYNWLDDQGKFRDLAT